MNKFSKNDKAKLAVKFIKNNLTILPAKDIG